MEAKVKKQVYRIICSTNEGKTLRYHTIDRIDWQLARLKKLGCYNISWWPVSYRDGMVLEYIHHNEGLK
jgi:hypothetical protein